MNKSENQLDTARYTVTWFATHASIPLSQIKKIHKLPLCKLFFNKCCETIEEYQRRRIAVACIVVLQNIKYSELGELNV
ncbi:hypothetical protein [Pseudoalteromonas maricaloris]|uniref:hypothetical protein n=1 Tax=Pseudoalteromonas maricaloris TaxID=184924 RepID=UPI003C23AE11